MIVDRLDIDVTGAEFARATGWRIEAQGACRGDVCVPLDGDSRTLTTVADRLGMPIVHDDSTGRSVWAVGPATVSGRALQSAHVPEDFELDDLDGNPFRLGTLRGRKVLLVAWASW